MEEIAAAAQPLLEEAGFSPDSALTPIPGGGNNQVFRVRDGSQRALLKAYFHHPGDPRDRLGAEFKFCEFAWNAGIHAVPRPLAADPQAHLGLYEFIDGRRLAPPDLRPAHVEAAMELIRLLDEAREDPAAMSLPPASEACFSFGEHLYRMELRANRLLAVNGASGPDAEAGEFIVHELLPASTEVCQFVIEGAAAIGLPVDEPLSVEDRCLSPSDFGFHNALLQEDHTVRFVDFEYAGWDGPAKLICDFFHHPAFPVPRSYFPAFRDALCDRRRDSGLQRERVRLLMPVHQLKWCCILLNEFLPVSSARRRFAGAEVDQLLRKQQQLQKARSLLARLEMGA